MPKVTITTFGFRNGTENADILVDARNMPNPYNYPRLRHLHGWDKEVRDEMRQSMIFRRTFEETLNRILEHKTDITVAIGCMGGRHRSVALACELADALAHSEYEVKLVHKDAYGKREAINDNIYEVDYSWHYHLDT